MHQKGAARWTIRNRNRCGGFVSPRTAGRPRAEGSQAPTVEALEYRLAPSSAVPSLPSPSPHGIAPERAGVASSAPVAQDHVDEMIQKWQADWDRVMARLTVIGAEIVGAAEVPEAIASREILTAAFWKSLSELERVETTLEAFDYAKNLHEFIIDPLASNATVHDALQKLVEASPDWFAAHPQFYKLAIKILAKGPQPTPAQAPPPPPPISAPPPDHSGSGSHITYVSGPISFYRMPEAGGSGGSADDAAVGGGVFVNAGSLTIRDAMPLVRGTEGSKG